ncbi:MAG: alpha-ketoacid dehydrogenase subunit beta, partial [Actinomycetota bacterium]|nr:alpha-ketoacid dehydrogenase subunit beta [Actinomycetota bacterium]
MREITFRESLNESLKYNLKNDPRVFCWGEDIGILGGAFGVTAGLFDEFGPDRIIDTPISEIAISGAAIGAAIGGLIPIAEIMYLDFTPGCMDMIINQMAKIRYMFGGQVKIPMVLRIVSGAMGYNAAQHSQSFYSFFVHTPGLVVVTPTTPYDVKGLFNMAVIDENPVIFIENKRLINIKGKVPEHYYTIPFGKADIKRQGKDLTIVATQALVYDALKVAEDMGKEGLSIEVIDPRTLKPFDKQTIFDSVKKTGKLIVCDEGWIYCGMASEISAMVSEECFGYLKAPVIRVAAPDTPCPFSPPLEDEYIPGIKNIKKAIK